MNTKEPPFRETLRSTGCLGGRSSSLLLLLLFSSSPWAENFAEICSYQGTLSNGKKDYKTGGYLLEKGFVKTGATQTRPKMLELLL